MSGAEEQLLEEEETDLDGSDLEELQNDQALMVTRKGNVYMARLERRSVRGGTPFYEVSDLRELESELLADSQAHTSFTDDHDYFESDRVVVYAEAVEGQDPEERAVELDETSQETYSDSNK